MSVDDYLIALKLHKQLNEEANDVNQRSPAKVPLRKPPATSLIDPEWEITDPNPDIHSLFGIFNVKFFWNALGAVEIKWSPRMYTCAGICTYKGIRGCIVSLSLPLLKFRPRKDLVETLLHEMIHAYLFVTKNNKDRGSHGPEFCKHMDRINKEAGTHITIYHSFHDEVNHYKTHVWRCNGNCKANPPYFGYVRRATNRAPGPNDFWFPEHLRTCGGSFDKVAEPENFKAKPRKKLKTDEKVEIKKKTPLLDKNQRELKNFFSSTSNKSPFKTTTAAAGSSEKTKNVVPNKVPLPSARGLSAPVHGIQPTKEQGGSIVKHGGIKNNIFGFGQSGSTSGTKSPEAEIKGNFKVPIIPFAGKGYQLGSSGANDKSKSRLLGTSTSSKNEVNKNTDKPSLTPSTSSNSAIYYEDLTGIDFEEDFNPSVTDLTSSYSSDEEEENLPHLNCPVCNSKIKRGVSINEHLDDCAQLESVFNSSRNDTLSDSDSDNEDYHSAATKRMSDFDSDNEELPPAEIKPNDRPASPPVNCPNCTAVLTASSINQHLDQCLSYD